MMRFDSFLITENDNSIRSGIWSHVRHLSTSFFVSYNALRLPSLVLIIDANWVNVKVRMILVILSEDYS